MSEVVMAPKGAKTVTVACKFPGGLNLRVFTMNKEREAVMGGGVREFDVARPMGDGVRVNGPALAIGAAVNKQIAGGYALTQGVDAEFFALWMEQNVDSALVKNKQIFCHASRDGAVSKAEEQSAVRSNLEPLDPTFTKKDDRIISNDPRFPKPLNPNLSPIHAAERTT